MKELIKRIPIIGDLAGRFYRFLMTPRQPRKPFPGSQRYWDDRYDTGGDSGRCSYGKFGDFKAEIINRFIIDKGVRSIIELGFGDGNQLALLKCPKYLGFEINETVVNKCRELFASDPARTFDLMRNYAGQVADLTLSLDVIYLLVEDHIFNDYMRTLFAASERYVIIYSSDTDNNRGYKGTYIRHRKFSRWIRQNLPDWKLSAHIPNRYPYKGDYTKGTFSEFFIYERA